MSAGAFTPAARAAIYQAGDGRCAGCLTVSPLTAQHRRARGMGGTTRAAAGHPANGVPLCGSGTTGCHGWTEHNPATATLLGWRLEAGQDPLVAPWWAQTYGWRRWTLDQLTVYVDRDDLDQAEARAGAVRAYLEHLDTLERPVPVWPIKPHR